jgi:anti-sigma-K factor RskA
MTAAHEELLDGVAAYAHGVLPPAQAADVIEHLRTCESCRAEYALLRPAVTAVALSAEACADATSGAAVARPLLKARVMKQVREEAAASRHAVRAPRVWPAYFAAAACFAIALLTGLAYLSLDARMAAQQQMVADMTSAGSQRHPFAGGEVLMHGERVYIMMHDMPPPPPGHVYQAWTVAKGAKGVAPSSTFAPAGGGGMVRLPAQAATLAAVAVTVEPDGGSQQPTTKPIAMVRL